MTVYRRPVWGNINVVQRVQDGCFCSENTINLRNVRNVRTVPNPLV